MNLFPYVILGMCLIPNPLFLLAAEQPNIIYILADGYGLWRCGG